MEENTTVVSCDELVKEFSKGVIVWYNFKLRCNILYIYTDKEDAAVKEFLQQKGKVVSSSCRELIKEFSDIKTVVEVNSDVKLEENKYDYIIGMDVLEEYEKPVELLQICRNILKTSGKLLLGTENRYAIKYICGDRDPYTNHNFDGIENYRRLAVADRKDIRGRCYSMVELKDMLEEAGFQNDKFYSVMPSLKEAQLIYAHEYKPVEELAMRYFPLYNYPNSVFLEEQYLYTDLIKNDMFHKMANAYIIECSLDGIHDETLHATISLDRGRYNALVTSICERDGVKNVYKKAVYPEGIRKLDTMQDNLDNLKSRDINVVESHVDGGVFVMPFVDAPIAMNELKEIAKGHLDEYIAAMDVMYELILNSSEHTDVISEKDKNSANGRDLGPILSKGYIDMMPLNCFYDVSQKNPKDRFIYYDQEFYWNNCPAKAVMYRAITIIYDGTDQEFEELIPKEKLFDRYGLIECSDIWRRMSGRFTDALRNQKVLIPYYEKERIDGRVLYTNREKVNYSTKEYQRIFVNIFKNFENTGAEREKKLILFGSGRFTERFLFQFGNDYPVYSIIDNNSSKWGTLMNGVPISSPDILYDIPEKERHIIICIKGYSGVVSQLKSMGIEDYHIYDPGNDYPNKRQQKVADRLAANGNNSKKYDSVGMNNNIEKADDKSYNVGYIAGVFDLFHIGHLNMFKRAKEQCKYLIVGVVSDEGVRLNKQAEPFVPFDERIEMVRSCKYVDEAVKLPLNFAGTRDMYKIYRFDVQFSGSDYEHDPAWLAEKEWLEKQGSTMVFFPYTQSTSSTKLKKAINSRIECEK